MKNYVKSLSFLIVVAVILNSAVTQTASNSIDQFIDAAKRGDLEEVRRFLGQNIRVDLRYTSRLTALMLACMNDHENIVRLLLEKGANTDLQDNNGNTALIYACVRGYENIVRLLLEKGANTDLQDNNGSTALIYACVRGYENIVRLLLEKGANTDLQDNNGNTALIYACVRDHENIARLLLEKGARVDLKNNNGNTALIYACVRDHENIARLLLEKGARVDLKNNNGNTALKMAGYNKPIAKMLEAYDTFKPRDISQFPTKFPDIQEIYNKVKARYNLHVNIEEEQLLKKINTLDALLQKQELLRTRSQSLSRMEEKELDDIWNSQDVGNLKYKLDVMASNIHIDSVSRYFSRQLRETCLNPDKFEQFLKNEYLTLQDPVIKNEFKDDAHLQKFKDLLHIKD